MQLVLKSGRFLFFFFIIFSISNSCDKIQESQIPYVHVDFTIPLSNNINLQVPGNTVYFPYVGYGGIIIYCAIPFQEYYAFDATCTYDLPNKCLVLKDQDLNLKNPPCLLSGPVVTCTCCDSKFITMIYAGANPLSGPASEPLKPYNTMMISSYTLRVYN
jgi:hypothetical protein